MTTYRMTSRQRAREFFLHAVFAKTGGRCHFCGARIRFDRRGFSPNPKGHWEVDHVVQRRHGGVDHPDNYLPACTTCNRLRWGYTGPELQHRLFVGYVAVREMQNGTKLGIEIANLVERRLEQKEGRRLANAERRKLRNVTQRKRRRRRSRKV